MDSEQLSTQSQQNTKNKSLEYKAELGIIFLLITYYCGKRSG
jgi:hypothetical protein